MIGKFPKIVVKDISIFLILVAVYFVSAKLGLQLAFVNASATAVWPPTGIALAAFLLLGYRFWPAIFLGAFLANVTTAGTILTSIGIATGNTLEGLVGAYLVIKFAGGRHAFDRPQNILRFAIFAGLLSTMISATIGLSSLTLGGFSDLNIFWSVWLTWWLGDVSGALLVAPLILVWSQENKINWNIKKILEGVLLLIALFLVGFSAFAGFIVEGSRYYSIDIIIFPVLLWAAFRFGVRETVTASFILSAMAMYYTLQGFGPFIRPSSPNSTLLRLQSFMALLLVMKAIVAAVVAENKEVDKLKNEFVSVASHELRTPMAAIKGLVSMVLEGRYGRVSEELKKPLRDVAYSTERLITLTNSLLDVSRIESGKIKLQIEDVSLQALVKEVVTNLNIVARQKGNTIEILKLDDKIVRADQDYLRQILQNLIGNAIKFTDSGKITISSKVINNMVFLSVTDAGIGISVLDQANIFKKFQQINPNNTNRPPGTGLGLYISRDLAKKMGGKLFLERSEPNKGSTFTLTVPLSLSELAKKVNF